MTGGKPQFDDLATRALPSLTARPEGMAGQQHQNDRDRDDQSQSLLPVCSSHIQLLCLWNFTHPTMSLVFYQKVMVA
jgi:hypothetical protein